MVRTPVSSSNLASVGYDPLTATLEVQFHSGDIYDYANVSLATYNQLLAAPSKGSFFYYAIRKGGYAYQKVFDNSTGMGSPEGAVGLTSPLAPIAGAILAPISEVAGAILPEAINPLAPPTVSPVVPPISDISGLGQ